MGWAAPQCRLRARLAQAGRPGAGPAPAATTQRCPGPQFPPPAAHACPFPQQAGSGAHPPAFPPDRPKSAGRRSRCGLARAGHPARPALARQRGRMALAAMPDDRAKSTARIVPQRCRPAGLQGRFRRARPLVQVQALRAGEAAQVLLQWRSQSGRPARPTVPTIPLAVLALPTLAEPKPVAASAASPAASASRANSVRQVAGKVLQPAPPPLAAARTPRWPLWAWLHPETLTHLRATAGGSVPPQPSRARPRQATTALCRGASSPKTVLLAVPTPAPGRWSR